METKNVLTIVKIDGYFYAANVEHKRVHFYANRTRRDAIFNARNDLRDNWTHYERPNGRIVKI